MHLLFPDNSLELVCDEHEGVQRQALSYLQKVAPLVFSDLALQAKAVLQGEIVGEVFTSLAQFAYAHLIGELGLPIAPLLEKLTELLDSPHWKVQLKAIKALGQIRHNILDAAIRGLLSLRHHQLQAIRDAADDALGELLSLETGIEDDIKSV